MNRQRVAAKPKPPSSKGLTRRTPPRYEADDGPLSDEQYAAIERLVPQKGFISLALRHFRSPCPKFNCSARDAFFGGKVTSLIG